MERHTTQWYSERLHKNMEIATYGHWGFALLLLPTAAADYLEYERFQLIDSISKYINEGKVKVFSINSINNESWLNNQMHPRHKAIRHQQFNEYVMQEVVPFIRTHCEPNVPIVTAGASFGALHAVNLCLRRPDVFAGCIGMSGCYELSDYTKGYHDEDVYFNSPMQYIPNLTDPYLLAHLRNLKHIHLVSGAGNYEAPEASRQFSGVLSHQGITHELDIWGHDVPHDWPTWRKMLPYYLETRF